MHLANVYGIFAERTEIKHPSGFFAKLKKGYPKAEKRHIGRCAGKHAQLLCDNLYSPNPSTGFEPSNAGAGCAKLAG